MRPAGFHFTVEATRGPARAGVFRTPHGAVRTPAFMPVGTHGAVRGVQPQQLRQIGTQILLANTYHLHLRPGEETVRELGGLHRFMGWDGPILTDSGGFQVFSLAEECSVDANGATFRSGVDGDVVRLTPERATEIQFALGPDIAMAFDHCAADPRDQGAIEAARLRTRAWLERCWRRHAELGGPELGRALFPIVQGGAFAEQRARAVEDVLTCDAAGYAIGGVSVGEGRADMLAAIDAAAPRLPADRPRYLMGVGTPRDFFDAVERGVDLFDCVTPSRHGRTSQAYTSRGRLNLRNNEFARDDGPLDPACDCTTCATFPRGSLRHYAKRDEILGHVLLTVHNLRFFHRLFEDLRAAIVADRVAEARIEWLRGYEPRAAR